MSTLAQPNMVISQGISPYVGLPVDDIKALHNEFVMRGEAVHQKMGDLGTYVSQSVNEGLGQGFADLKTNELGKINTRVESITRDKDAHFRTREIARVAKDIQNNEGINRAISIGASHAEVQKHNQDAKGWTDDQKALANQFSLNSVKDFKYNDKDNTVSGGNYKSLKLQDASLITDKIAKMTSLIKADTSVSPYINPYSSDTQDKLNLYSQQLTEMGFKGDEFKNLMLAELDRLNKDPQFLSHGVRTKEEITRTKVRNTVLSFMETDPEVKEYVNTVELLDGFGFRESLSNVVRDPDDTDETYESRVYNQAEVRLKAKMKQAYNRMEPDKIPTAAGHTIKEFNKLDDRDKAIAEDEALDKILDELIDDDNKSIDSFSRLYGMLSGMEVKEGYFNMFSSAMAYTKMGLTQRLISNSAWSGHRNANDENIKGAYGYTTQGTTKEVFGDDGVKQFAKLDGEVKDLEIKTKNLEQELDLNNNEKIKDYNATINNPDTSEDLRQATENQKEVYIADLYKRKEELKTELERKTLQRDAFNTNVQIALNDAYANNAPAISKVREDISNLIEKGGFFPDGVDTKVIIDDIMRRILIAENAPRGEGPIIGTDEIIRQALKEHGMYKPRTIHETKNINRNRDRIFTAFENNGDGNYQNIQSDVVGYLNSMMDMRSSDFDRHKSGIIFNDIAEALVTFNGTTALDKSSQEYKTERQNIIDGVLSNYDFAEQDVPTRTEEPNLTIIKFQTETLRRSLRKMSDLLKPNIKDAINETQSQYAFHSISGLDSYNIIEDAITKGIKDGTLGNATVLTSTNSYKDEGQKIGGGSLQELIGDAPDIKIVPCTNAAYDDGGMKFYVSTKDADGKALWSGVIKLEDSNFISNDMLARLNRDVKRIEESEEPGYEALFQTAAALNFSTISAIPIKNSTNTGDTIGAFLQKASVFPNSECDITDTKELTVTFNKGTSKYSFSVYDKTTGKTDVLKVKDSMLFDNTMSAVPFLMDYLTNE